MHERGERVQSEGGAVSLREAVRLSDGAFLMGNTTKKNPAAQAKHPPPPRTPHSSEEPAVDGAELLEPVH